MDVTGKFPIYEADQVLSANHLNQSLAYLEKHDRLSRRLLHGTGIVCGLEFSVSEGELHITKGCGITSEGYLIALEKSLILTKVRKYVPPYPPKYEPLYDDGDKPFALWEVVPETEAEGEQLQTLSKLSLNGKVLLLYLEAKDKDLKDCIGDDCDNNGTVREFTLRPLIISLSDLVKIFNKDGNTVEDIASSVLARYMLKEIIPPRFDVTPNNVTTSLEIKDAYQDLSDSILPEIKMGLMQIEAIFADSLGEDKIITSALSNLQDRITEMREQEVGAQYLFDHLCDIAAAYNELVEVATKWLVTCMPSEDDFPMHLALGEFSKINAEAPLIFRNYFKHASAAPESHRTRKHVSHLYRRLIKVLQSFKLEKTKSVEVIISNYGRHLSDKAVPYYYQPKSETDYSWLRSWSFELNERGSWQRVPHYYNQPQKQLLRDIEFHNFFRIEGHLGRKYSDALEEINDKVNRYRLPVKTVALSTGSAAMDPNLLEDCHVTDLDGQYATALDSLMCQLQEVSCFLGAIPLPGAAKANESSARLASHATAGHAAASAPSASANLNISATAAYSSLKAATSRLSLAGVTAKAFKKGQFIGTKCNLKAGSLGKAYFDYVNGDDYNDISLLDLYLPYLNLSERSASSRQVLLIYNFSIVVIDEIEELVGILHNKTLSTLDFKLVKAFAEEFMAFVRLFINEIDRLEKEPEFESQPILHDIKHHMVHLMGLCKLKTFFALYRAYRLRLQEALKELRFSNFIKRHPGIDHKAGVPKGGTFILVYHAAERDEEELDLEPKIDKPLRPFDTTALFTEVSHYNPAAKMASTHYTQPSKSMNVKDANTTMRDNLTNYAMATGRSINAATLNRFEEFLGGLAAKKEEQVTLPEGTVVADFYLPYMCTSGCGGIEINVVEPVVPLSLALPRNRFCLGDEETYEFVVSPIGGAVTGPGVSSQADKFIFKPASEDVNLGTLTFTYTFEGRTTQTQVAIIPKPEAAFEAFVDNSPNGTFVGFENSSSNATKFEWDFGNGQKSTEKDPKGQVYKLDQETAVVTLKASNGVCEDIHVETITLFTKEFEMRIGKEQTEFCSDEKTHPIDIRIKGVGRETFPYSGVVKGKGVSAPTGANQPNFMFDPGKAGVGNHKLVYEVEGSVAAELSVTVEKQFVVSFSAVARRSADGVTVGITKIKPTDKKSYNWRFDEKKPTDVIQRKNATDFNHFYSPNDIGNRKEISIELQVNDSPCVARKSVTVTIPAEPQRGGGEISFDPTVLTNEFVLNTGTRTNFSALTHLTSATSSPTAAAQQLLNNIAEGLKKTATRKKLTNGSMNAKMGKEFLDVATGLQTYYTKNRRTMNTKQRSAIMELYGKVAEGMINFIGLQKSDLKATETLAKNFKTVGENAKAMAKLGMPSAVKNGIKDRLSALSKLNKPVAAGLAVAFRNAIG